MMMTGKMTFMFLIYTRISGLFCQIKEKFLCPDQVLKEYFLTINYSSLEAIKKRVEISIKIFFIMTYWRSNGMMLVHFRAEKFLVKEQIIRLFYGMEDCLYMVDMMVKKDLEICSNVVLRTKSLSGKKYRVRETNH
jgi:hypothetical protein